MTNNAWNSEDPAQVVRGGTGAASHTAFAVLTGGTTTTNPIQSIAGVGTSGQVLTSNGAAALPTFQDAAGGGGGAWNWVSTTTASNDAFVTFSSLSASAYKIVVLNLDPATDNTQLNMQVSTSSSFATADYQFAFYEADQSDQGPQIGSNETEILINFVGIGTATGEFGFCGEFTVLSTATASFPAYITWRAGFMNSNGGDWTSTVGSGCSADESNGGNTSNVDGVRFFMSSGNISSGDFHLYSLVTS